MGTCAPACGAIGFLPRGSPSNLEARRRISSFILVYELSAALTRRPFSKMRALWVVGKQSRSGRMFSNAPSSSHNFRCYASEKQVKEISTGEWRVNFYEDGLPAVVRAAEVRFRHDQCRNSRACSAQTGTQRLRSGECTLATPRFPHRRIREPALPIAFPHLRTNLLDDLLLRTLKSPF